MRERKYSKDFKKHLIKLKGKELQNLINKRDEILNSQDINHYKNLRKPLQRYKRVHVNSSYIIIFFGDDGTVYFVDYQHHDKAYDKDYSKVEF